MSAAGGHRTVLLGLGANLGDTMTTLRRAADRLAAELEAPAASPVYLTPAEGGAPQPAYLNAVLRGRTDMGPDALLELVRRVEDEGGRVRPHPGAARTLDIDILFMGDLIVSEAQLRIPHPRWAARDFVVVPLLDVAPGWVDPVTGRSVREVASSRGWSSDRFPVVAAAGALLHGGES
ncbi:MAG TPA: 2-amino-4-hydroxy-6-hydroxymethyldihydropteridine diphosphokinase [Longimicrobiales bacterium]|nr:2-amino-4-hydroxy-6-hydroxymethyldihydropteridine diphosphokinase [Longimicrobiales bacterium]